MRLNDIKDNAGARKERVRVGRGIGSGLGKTAGRGGKGQTARAGYKALSIFQGGATPLVRRVPKRGFTNSFAATVVSVNVGDIDREFAAGEEVTPESLVGKGLIPKRHDEVKILGDGELKKGLKITAHKFSASARQKIADAKGEVVELAGPIPVAVKQAAAKEARKQVAAKKKK